MTVSSWQRAAAVALSSVVLIAACGGGGATSAAPSTEPSTGASTEPSVEPLTGEISISGSSTVQPISLGVQEAFNEANPDVAITVDGPGTGDGFKLFCAGETDISDASRKIKDEEKTLCTDGGVKWIELKVAIDGLSILTSVDDTTAPACLSYADLYALIGPESEGFDNWGDGQALATELGSTTTLPDLALMISGPGEESGTYDYFVEQVITKWAGERSQENATRKDYNSNPNDNVIIEGIAGAEGSLGWVGYAYAEENLDKVKFFEVAKEPGTCVAPTKETIADNSYPLSRALYIYVNTDKADVNPALQAFVDFYLAEGTISAVNDTVGYVDLAADALAESRSAWDGR